MPKLSIIIVAYENMDCLAACLASIPQEPWIEVLVVNNTHQNRGFGAGCTIGAALAQGEYLLFLNPDCLVDKNALQQMLEIIMADDSIGILGPRLLDDKRKPYSSCNAIPTKISAPIVYSGLNAWLYNTPLVKRYWYDHVVPSTQIEVGSVSGAALMMRRRVFTQMGGFDERFFLYWEELDLAMRVRLLKKKVVFDPSASIVHSGGLSTIQPRSQTMQWFRESRVTFFKKYFGWGYGTLLEGWLTITEEWPLVLAGLLVLIGATVLFQSGWWLLPGQLWFLQRWLFLSVFSPAFSFWIGVVGTIMGMIAFYNETSLLRRWLSTLMSFLVAGLFLAAAPVNWLLLIICGLGWIFFDSVITSHWWRKIFVGIALVVNVGFLSAILIKDLGYQGFITSGNQWQEVAAVIRHKAKGNPVTIRCVGCSSSDEWELLKWQLKQYGVSMQSWGEPVYVIVPPLATSDAAITGTASVMVGSVKVAWPFDAL